MIVNRQAWPISRCHVMELLIKVKKYRRSNAVMFTTLLLSLYFNQKGKGKKTKKKNKREKKKAVLANTTQSITEKTSLQIRSGLCFSFLPSNTHRFHTRRHTVKFLHQLIITRLIQISPWKCRYFLLQVLHFFLLGLPLFGGSLWWASFFVRLLWWVFISFEFFGWSMKMKF